MFRFQTAAITSADGSAMLVNRRMTPAEQALVRDWEREHPNAKSDEPRPVTISQLMIDGTVLSITRSLLGLYASPDANATPSRAPLDLEETRRVGKLLDELIASSDELWAPKADEFTIEDDYGRLMLKVLHALGPATFGADYLSVERAFEYTEAPATA